VGAELPQAANDVLDPGAEHALDGIMNITGTKGPRRLDMIIFHSERISV